MVFWGTAAQTMRPVFVVGRQTGKDGGKVEETRGLYSKRSASVLSRCLIMKKRSEFRAVVKVSGKRTALITASAAAAPPKEVARKKVVVVGGGWAGFAAAKHLSSQDNVEVILLDAQANPGGLSTSFMTEQGREVEAGVKGFWEDYPNINALCDELEIQPFTEFLTSGFWKPDSGEGEHRRRRGKLVTEAPVFSSKPQLPTIVGQFLYTSPLFYDLSILDRMTIIPWLYDILNFRKDQATYEEYDTMTAREMFKRRGISNAAYKWFLKPTLGVGLFAPPEDLSAAVTLELLCFYALNSQNAFDVKWCKGSITEKIFQPLVSKIQESGAKILGSRLVTRVDEDGENKIKISALNTSLKKPKTEEYEADALVFALSISGMKKIVGASPFLASKEEFRRIMNLRSIDCIATRIWFDRELPTRFPANVLANFENCGATYFNTTDMQGRKEEDPGTVISAGTTPEDKKKEFDFLGTHVVIAIDVLLACL